MESKKIEIKENDTDVQVALKDIERKRGEIAEGCLRVWDTMEGVLPPFDEFCRFYVRGRFMRWYGKARWN